jgi:hypothetical protein
MPFLTTFDRVRTFRAILEVTTVVMTPAMTTVKLRPDMIANARVDQVPTAIPRLPPNSIVARSGGSAKGSRKIVVPKGNRTPLSAK